MRFVDLLSVFLMTGQQLVAFTFPHQLAMGPPFTAERIHPCHPCFTFTNGVKEAIVVAYRLV